MYDGMIVRKQEFMIKVKPNLETYMQETMRKCLGVEENLDSDFFDNIRDPVNESNGVVLYANSAKY
jgi:hypothetical protein